jgi:NADH dehydrogenase
MAGAFSLTPFPAPITSDQVKLLAHDNVLSDGALTLANLGIKPASVEAALPTLLARFIKA